MARHEARIVALDVHDIRFPTSRTLDGSDAMNPDPDYSATYTVLRTDSAELAGHALAFTIGRGNELLAAAVSALREHVVGRPVDELCEDLGSFQRSLTHDPQLRWLGPEKGVVHMAAGAVVNAAWDLAARRAATPVWQFLSHMPSRQLVDLIDFRYLTDALSPAEALEMLTAAEPGRAAREEQLIAEGYPAYATSPGWIGYDDAKLERLCREAVEDGFTQVKIKVGGRLEDDARRLGIARSAVGDGVRIAIDANQRWGVAEAIGWVNGLAVHHPYWIEEPTSPDDILGHAAIRSAVAPVKVATGEHVQNQVVFKQLLQADAVNVVQIDAARLPGAVHVP